MMMQEEEVEDDARGGGGGGRGKSVTVVVWKEMVEEEAEEEEEEGEVLLSPSSISEQQGDSRWFVWSMGTLPLGSLGANLSGRTKDSGQKTTISRDSQAGLMDSRIEELIRARRKFGYPALLHSLPNSIPLVSVLPTSKHLVLIQSNQESTNFLIGRIGKAEEDSNMELFRAECDGQSIPLKAVYPFQDAIFALDKDGNLLECTIQDQKPKDQEQGDLELQLGYRVQFKSLFHAKFSGQSIVQLSCGASFAIALTNSGDLFSWGRNTDGALGLGTEVLDVALPVLVENIPEVVVKIDCGWNHAALISQSGHLYCWGSGSFGKLGLGDSRNVFCVNEGLVQFPTDSTSLVDVACGYAHTCSLDSDGNIYSWGDNARGQLGLGDFTPRNRPKLIEKTYPRFVSFSAIQCGAFHCAAISADGKLFTWGLNSTGQTGHLKSSRNNLPRMVNFFSKKETALVYCGGDYTVVVTKNLLDIQLDYFSESSISPKSSSPQLRDRYSNNIPVFFQERDERSRSSRALSAIGLDTVSSQNLRKTSLGRTSFDIFKNKRNSIQQRSSFEKKVHIEEYNRLIRSQHKEKLKCERRSAYEELQKYNALREQQQEELKEKKRLEKDCKFWNSVLSKWDEFKCSSRVHGKILEIGIPPVVRKEAWPIIIGNSLGITEKIFDACSVVFRASLNPKADSEPIFSEHISIIEVDLRRTFPGLSFYHEETQLRTQLQDILQRYCALRLDCGYVQGMSYLGGHLLLYMSPFLAFRSLCNLLSGVLLRDFTSLDTVRMGQWISIFEEILKVLLPHLHSGFIDIQIFADTCLTEWFMTLFSKTLALDVVGRVWDGYLVLGEPFLFQISISILKILEPKISHQPLEVAIKALRTLPKNISSAELFNSIPSWTRVPRKIREQIQRLRRDPSRSGGVDLQKLNALSLQ